MRRLIVDIASFVLFGLIAMYILTNHQDLFGTNPITFIGLIPLKVSMGVIHWHLFRKMYFGHNSYSVGKVNWTIKSKDMDSETLINIISFVMFMYAYTAFS